SEKPRQSSEHRCRLVVLKRSLVGTTATDVLQRTFFAFPQGHHRLANLWQRLQKRRNQSDQRHLYPLRPLLNRASVCTGLSQLGLKPIYPSCQRRDVRHVALHLIPAISPRASNLRNSKPLRRLEQIPI